jgi:hypothetical protein
VAVRQARSDERLARLQSELTREERAEDVLTRYREPLAVAAFDLQSRLYNILQQNFFRLYGGAHPRSEVSVQTTLFRVAQYFGWTEILRRDIQYLSFPEADETRRVVQLQSAVAEAFRSDGYGQAMMIWADEQRALGEQMIVEEHGKVLSMGFAAFRDRCRDTFAPSLARIRDELSLAEAEARLRDVQHALCDLVEALDVNRVRYPDELLRA